MFCLIVVMLAPVTYAVERFFPVAKVKPGMEGEALTVFHGTTIDKFKVKVLAIVNSDYDGEKLILVRLEGKEIQKSGGLAAGMSGSPVYIKGRLVGAISYGFENADPFLAYVTPIQSMLKLLDNANKEEYFTYYRKRKKLLPVATPVLISGTGHRGFLRLARSFRELGLQAVYLPEAAGAVPPSGKAVSFKPGSAVAVQLVNGDYRVAALGTVTMVDGKNFLAFGHSFTNRGKVDFLAYQAQIHHIVKSPVLPIKLGSSLYPVGRIVEDRHYGIAGRLNEFPTLIDVAINIKDVERDRWLHSDFQVINNEQFYSKLVTEVATAAVDRSLDRVGSGTAKVIFKIFTKDNPVPFVRENLIFSKDIAVSCFQELATVVEAFANNAFVPIRPQLIQIDVQIENRNLTATVQKLEVDRTEAKPGESVKIRVYLHPFRGTNFCKTFTVKIPDSISPGKYLLSVRGGSEKPAEARDNSKNAAPNPSEPLVDSFEELLAGFRENPQNNELVLEVVEVSEQTGNCNCEPVRLKVRTDYFLTGRLQQELKIIK